MGRVVLGSVFFRFCTYKNKYFFIKFLYKFYYYLQFVRVESDDLDTYAGVLFSIDVYLLPVFLKTDVLGSSPRTGVDTESKPLYAGNAYPFTC